MDPRRFSAIAHGELPFWNPIAPAVLDTWLDDLSLPPGARVLDIGCGPGELLIRLARRHDCQGAGVDRHAQALDRGRERLAATPGAGRLELVEGDFRPADWAPASLDLIACLGASQALGGFDPLVAFAAERLAPGGWLLVGEGYWAAEPDPAYLEGLGGTRDDLHDDPGNQAVLASHGLAVQRSHRTTTAEWDRYEDTYRDNVLAHLRDHPDDPDALPMRERISGWRTLYETWGRTTLGFGLYLARRSG